METALLHHIWWDIPTFFFTVQRPTTRSNPQIQSDQSSTGRTDFGRTVMETMQRLTQRLDSLAERVEGNDGRNRAMTESSLTSGSTPTLWADRPIDEPLDSLPMPQWDDQDEESADVESRRWCKCRRTHKRQ